MFDTNNQERKETKKKKKNSRERYPFPVFPVNKVPVGEGVSGPWFRSTGLQVYRYTGLQVYRSTGIQVYRYTGLQVYRSTGLQVYRSTGLQVYRSAGFPLSINWRWRHPWILGSYAVYLCVLPSRVIGTKTSAAADSVCRCCVDGGKSPTFNQVAQSSHNF